MTSYLNITMIVSIIFAVLAITAASSPSCTPSYLLHQVIHDSVTISSFNTSASLTQTSYSYPYFQNLFTGQPTVIISISQLFSSSFSQLNYQLSGQIQNKSLNFYFASKNMSWTSLQIQFILHSRTDIFSNIATIAIQDTVKTTVVQYQASVAANSSFIFSHFIIGIVAAKSANYSIGVKPFTVSNEQYEIVAASSSQGSITIQSVYFDSSQSAFSYSLNQFTLQSSANPQYKNIWARYNPAIYTLFGFSSLQFAASSLSLSLDFDFVSSLLTVGKLEGFTSVTISSFSIGELPSNVCSPCNNFIFISGCLDSCPNNSYSETLAEGGKTCRQCNSNLGQALNTQATSCVCQAGQIYQEGNCYDLADLPPACATGQILIGKQCVKLSVGTKCLQANEVYSKKENGCICATKFQRYQGSCLLICPANSKRASSGACACSPGYLMNNQQQCESKCPANSAFDVSSSTCICEENYQMAKGVCKACSPTEVYNSNTKTCNPRSSVKVSAVVTPLSIICRNNEVLVNNVCQCDQYSVKKNSACVRCPTSTYKLDDITNQCAPCSSYCLNCQSNTSCTECRSGFSVTGQNCSQICGDGKKYILACDDGNTLNGDGCSSICQIEAGYVCNGGDNNHRDVCQKLQPNTKISIAISHQGVTYLSSGIITDFVLRPPIQRTHDELTKLFKITFSTDIARPKSIAISQGEKDLTSIRCYFSYNNDLPNSIFRGFFTVLDNNYGQDSITIMYNSLVNPVKSSISYLNGDSSDIIS